MKKRKPFLISLLIIAVIGIYLAFTWRQFYWTRVLAWGNGGVEDYQIFPTRPMEAADEPWDFPNATVEEQTALAQTLDNIPATLEIEGHQTSDFSTFLTNTETTAFLVIKEGELVYEQYFNGYERDSVFSTFSVSKSFISALIGLAIEDGFIGSENDSIAIYLPEFVGTEMEKITIHDLLTMTSGIRFEGTLMPWDDFARTYYTPDLRQLALTAESESPTGVQWEYNDYHPLLLGLILERATGTEITAYLESKLWANLGTEFDGSWSLDEFGFEKLASGLNARPIDYAKFGLLFLNNGRFGNETLLSEEWVQRSTRYLPDDNPLLTDVPGSTMGLSEHPYRYKYFWWINPQENRADDFFAYGNFGQFIYISPDTDSIVVRFGETAGDYTGWTDVFSTIAEIDTQS
ncbi:serine hydrolase domain-containing protein [Candidatus Leptofilum sp.]|uniref:serine hydrolase domain-containing protein n=1 Tax=Candidatus Leptofilum sp. TaxID=3241576 RepID=UPI003B5A2AA1